MRPASQRARALCLPSAIAGPLCSVPPIGTSTVVKRELRAGQTLLIDTGCIVALTPNVSFEIQYVGKIKTALFGGEGLFFAKCTGPGTVWLQSLPFSRLASRVFAAAPQRGGSKEEGGLFGGLAAGGLLGGVFGGGLGGGDDD